VGVAIRRDDLGVCDRIGADHMLMGSDYPHAEGLAEPARTSRTSSFGFGAEDSKWS
jgi:hypothetical protein